MKFEWRKDSGGIWAGDINLRVRRDGESWPPLVGWVRFERGNWVAVCNDLTSGGSMRTGKFSTMLPAMRWLRRRTLMRILAGEI